MKISDEGRELALDLYRLWAEWTDRKDGTIDYYDYIGQRLVDEGWVKR